MICRRLGLCWVGGGALMRAVLHWEICLERNQALWKELNKCAAPPPAQQNFNLPVQPLDWLSIAFCETGGAAPSIDALPTNPTCFFLLYLNRSFPSQHPDASRVAPTTTRRATCKINFWCAAYGFRMVENVSWVVAFVCLDASSPWFCAFSFFTFQTLSARWPDARWCHGNCCISPSDSCPYGASRPPPHKTQAFFNPSPS